MRRKDSSRVNNDIWLKLSDNINLSEIETIDNIREEDILEFNTFSDEERNYYIQHSVLPLTGNRIVVSSIFIRVPNFILANNPTILVWEKDKINELLHDRMSDNSKLVFNKNTKSLEAIKEILAKMDHLNSSDITISWRRDKVVISYTIFGRNSIENEDILETEFADKLRLSLINISYENQSSKLIDGKFSLYIKGELREYRLSSIETIAGNAIVIRSYPVFNTDKVLQDLGYMPKPMKIIESIIENNPYGVFLVTGPTGSGKTTTIYTILNEQFQKKNLRIKTAEDPVENEIDGLDQCQINEKGDKENHITYVGLLRSFMRQRPNIIAIGEIRDSEVAKVTIEAALTGHIVISTLHTNDVESTFTRLYENMDISKDRIEDSMSGVLSQRLVDKLCDCKIKNGNFYERNENGCEKCKNGPFVGYDGQIPAVEIAELFKGRKNYIKENFVQYYSYEDSANELYEKGFIDIRVKKLIENFN